MAYKRETAHRVTSKEYTTATKQLKGQGEKTPNHQLTTLGAKINRIHLVGVCTEIDNVGDGSTIRARVSDPLGTFNLYAGQYQPEAAHTLSQLTPPCYVAVTGKAKSYEPEPGKVLLSISPETVSVVDEATRDHWVLDAVKCTQERLEAVEAYRGGAKTLDALKAAGVRESVAEGVLLAAEHYEYLDVDGYKESLSALLRGLLSGDGFETHTEAPDVGVVVEPAKAWKAPETPAEPSADEEAFDEAVHGVIKELEGESGAKWDDILEASKSKVSGASDESVEAALNRLMDAGLIYEPILSVIRST